MNNRLTHIIILTLLLFNNNLYSAGILGKVLLYKQENKPPKINPIFDGDSINYQGKYVIILSGAAIMPSPGTSITATQESDVTVIKLTSGNAKFRIDSSQIMVSFRTPHGEVYTPRVYPASSSIVDGGILVKENTILELNQGIMESRTINGTTTIKSGQAVLLSQAQIDKPASGSENAAGKTENSNKQQDESNNQVPGERKPMPDELVELLSLIGEEGNAVTPLKPDGQVKIAAVKQWDGKGQIVDYDLSRKDKAYLPQGSDVKVVCVNVDDHNTSQLLVRPVDRLYPEQEGEINLVNLNAEAESDMQPEGFIKIKPDKNDEKFKNRSLNNWDAVVVDNKMQPENGAYILEDTDLKVVCLRSVLLVQPNYLVNKEQLKLVGKTAVLVKEFSSPGKVNLEGKIYNAVPVDYNMQIIPNFQVPVGTELTVVGVRGTDSTLLVQKPDEVLKELKFVGKEVESLDKMKPYGEVLLSDEDGGKWSSVLVTSDLIPFYGVKIEKGTKLTVIGVFTQLLVTESDILVGWYNGSTFLPLLTVLGIVGGTIGGTITGIQTGGGGNGPPPPPGDDDDESSPIF